MSGQDNDNETNKITKLNKLTGSGSGGGANNEAPDYRPASPRGIPPVIGAVMIVVITAILAAVIAAFVFGAPTLSEFQQPAPLQYTKNITIQSVDPGARDEPYFIISTEGITYPTSQSEIYQKAERLVGSEVTITYTSDAKIGCDVIDIGVHRNICVIVPGVGCKDP